MKNLKSRLAATTLALLVAITLALLVVVAFVAPAKAETREEFCTTASNLTMALAELRDMGIRADVAYQYLVVESGWPTEAARKTVYNVWVRGSEFGPRQLGYAVWTSCMGESS